jgi:hypothetical protein
MEDVYFRDLVESPVWQIGLLAFNEKESDSRGGRSGFIENQCLLHPSQPTRLPAISSSQGTHQI